MTIVFDRPKGVTPQRDVAELLYTSTLLQTQRTCVREDVRLTGQDIQLYLSSRYGIKISLDECDSLLLQELAGSNCNDNNSKDKNSSSAEENESVGKEELDLVQFTSLLFIPILREVLEKEEQKQDKKMQQHMNDSFLEPGSHLRSRDVEVGGSNRQSQQKDFQTPISPDCNNGIVAKEEEEEEDIVSAVLHIILHEADLEYGSPLNEETLQRVLMVFREDTQQWPDKMVNDMIQQASTVHPVGDTDVASAAVSKADVETPSDNGHNPSQDDVDRHSYYNPRWDRSTCLRALTRDIQIYDVRRQNMFTTHYEDALATTATVDHISSHIDSPMNLKQEMEEAMESEEEEKAIIKTSSLTNIQQQQAPIPPPSNPLKRNFTASHIDSAVDTYSSFLWVITAWMCFAVNFFAYLFDGIQPRRNWFGSLNCTEPVSSSNTKHEFSISEVGDNFAATLEYFGCQVLDSTLFWLEVFIKLGLLGSFFLFTVALGNSVYLYGQELQKQYRATNSIWKFRLQSVGQFAIGIVVNIICAYVLFAYRAQIIAQNSGDVNSIVAYLTPFMGSLLLLIQLVQLFRLFRIPTATDESDGKSCSAKLAVSKPIQAERQLKIACQYKVARMIENALACHCDPTKLKGNNYDLNGFEERIEGDLPKRSGDEMKRNNENLYNQVVSTMKGLDRNRSASSDADIRYAIPIADTEQVGGIIWTYKKLRDRTAFSEEGLWLFPRLISANILQWIVAVFYLGATLWLNGYIDNEIPDETLEQLHLTRLELQIASNVAGMPSFIGACYVALVYIPSALSTVLKYRSGVLSCSNNRDFLQNRYAMDTTNLLFGAAFWATIVSGAMIYITLFFIVWTMLTQHPELRPIFNSIYANIIGASVTMGIKIIFMQWFRIQNYGGFMRRRPGVVNVLNLVQDAWALGISTLVIAMRMLRLFGCAIFYIGRVDTPFLSPSVGWLLNRFPPDPLPFIFRRDLLMHEAHRHPFIERIGYLYLLKLGNRNDFGKREGAAWRLLFTVVLMPWLRQYRHRREQLIYNVSSGGDGDDDDQNRDSNPNKAGFLARAQMLSLQRSNADMKRKLAKAVALLKNRRVMGRNDDANNNNITTGTETDKELESFLSMYNSQYGSNG